MPLTIPELHHNEELRRHEFPVAAQSIFLGHAGVCPLPRRVAQASADYLQACQNQGQEAALPAGLEPETRLLAARLLNCSADEIALVGPTSLALSFIASGLKFRRNENILIYHDDYPSNVYPWMALADRVQVRLINVRELGRIRLIDVQGQVDDNTRLVALASAHYLTGWRLNLDAMGKWLRAREILFSVDGIQTLGAFPVNANSCDFLAADSHKWMLGPSHAGLFFVRKAVQSRLQPMVHGWHNLRCQNFLTQSELEFKPDARRYECGTNNFLGMVGLREALRLLLEVGPEAIGAELVRKRNWLVASLQAKGYEVVSPEMPTENAGGHLSFHRPGTDLAPLHQRLTKAGIVTSLRHLPGGTPVIRVAPHFYNTDAELHRVLEHL
jgi:selenocysteine lyase/cysteine desulfurase